MRRPLLSFLICALCAVLAINESIAMASALEENEADQIQYTVETLELPFEDEPQQHAETLNWIKNSPSRGTGIFEDGISDKVDTISKIVNAFADIMKKVIAPETPLMKGNVIAEARPEGVAAISLQNSKISGKTFRKLFKSLLGFKLVEVEYKVSYSYAADYNSKGQYVPYVLFTPLKIVLDPMWHLEVDSLSLAPRNCGTLEDPIAGLEFNLAFKAKGITGTIMATDSFSLNAKTGELTADWRDFQP